MQDPKDNKEPEDEGMEELEDDEEGDFIDDEENEDGVRLTDEQLKEMGIDMDHYNSPLQPGEETESNDGQSWVSDDDPQHGEDMEEDPEINQSGTSIQSYSDRIKRAFKGHQDAVLCLAVLGEHIFTGGMDDYLIKWKFDEDKPVAFKKVHLADQYKETVSFLDKREESDLLAAGFLDDTIVVIKGTTFEDLQVIKTEYEEIAVAPK